MGKEFYSPPSPEEVKKQLLSLRAGFPRVRVFSAGRSSQGRDIPALLAGSPHGAALFVAGAAAGEGMATRILLRFSRDLLLAAGENAALTEINAAKALENRGVFVIPQLNPDGAALLFRGGENTPPRARLMAELLARAAGYRVSSAPLESGSFPLWFVEAFRKPAFQLSIGGGRSFCPKEEELLYRRLLETMMTGLLL